MYKNYDIEQDKQGQFRAYVSGTKCVVCRCKTRYELEKTMQMLQTAFVNGKSSGEIDERIRIRLLLGL